MVGRNIGLPTYLLWLGSNSVQKIILNSVNFSRTKNTCSGNPPNNLGTCGIFNTGVTPNYIKVGTPYINNTAVYNFPQVILSYESLMQATYQA